MLRSTVMLEPANTEVLGCSVDHLEEHQPTSFLASLARRMGKAVPGEDAAPTAQAANGRAARTRLPPPVRHAQPVIIQQQGGPGRSRDTQTRLSFSPSKSPERPAPASTARSRHPPPPDRQINGTPPLSARRPMRAASSAASARVAGLYQQTQLVNDAMDGPTPSKRSRSTRQAPARLQANAVVDVEDEDDCSMEFDDSFLREVDQVTASASAGANATASGRNGNEDQEDVDDEEWGYLDDDDSFICQIDEAEAAATSQPRQTATTGSTTSRYFQSGRKASSTARDRQPVYVVDSDGSSTKENTRPTDIVYISD